MRRAAAVVLFLSAAAASAHPGHGMADGHWHGFSPELLLLALFVAAWAALRK
jgi:hypothetical protein